MARAESLNPPDRLNTIVAVEIAGPLVLGLSWSGGSHALIDLRHTASVEPYRALNDPSVFEAVEIGDWGHSLVWPGDIELGADTLWLDTLEASGREDASAFIRWRLRHGLSVAAASGALGVAEREIARFSNGETPVPRTILLACRGWEALQAA